MIPALFLWLAMALPVDAPPDLRIIDETPSQPYGPMILIWDRLSAHKSRMVQDFIAEQHGRIHTEYVPAYAPDLNPVEYLWGHWKQHELPNVCPKDWWELNERARRTLRKMRRRPTLIAAFWKQAELSF